MHELAVTEGLVNLAVKEGEKAGASKILEIRLKMGSLSGYLPECIEEYYDIVSEGTIAHKARLTFDILKGKVKCIDCGAETEVVRYRFICEKCNSRRVNVISGNEFYIDSMEIESDE